MTLALLGGQPIRSKPFCMFPAPSPRALEEIKEVLDSGLWNALYARRTKHHEFEESFARLQRARHAIACANGTAALKIALRAAGIRAGDEVITSPYTCWASIEAILQVNAVPVFADVAPGTYCLDPNRAREAVTPRTKAIVPVHFGMVADLDALSDVARERSLVLIEDCALAHGSEWKGRPIGAIGDLGTFSFGCHKLIQAGEAGAVVTNRADLADICRSIVNLGGGQDSSGRLGWNYRLSEILAALLVAQLEHAPAECEHREANALYLTARLNRLPGIAALDRDPRVTRFGYCWFILRSDAKLHGIERNTLVKALNAEGIPVTGGYIQEPLSKHGIFRNDDTLRCLREPAGVPAPWAHYHELRFPATEQACREGIWLLHPVLLTPREDVHDVVRAFEKVLESANRLRSAAPATAD